MRLTGTAIHGTDWCVCVCECVCVCWGLQVIPRHLNITYEDRSYKYIDSTCCIYIYSVYIYDNLYNLHLHYNQKLLCLPKINPGSWPPFHVERFSTLEVVSNWQVEVVNFYHARTFTAIPQVLGLDTYLSGFRKRVAYPKHESIKRYMDVSGFVYLMYYPSYPKPTWKPLKHTRWQGEPSYKWSFVCSTYNSG